MPTISIRNISIHYREQGTPDRPVLLLIHGLGCSLKYWACLFAAQELSPYRIIALDLPGFGLSEKPDAFDYRFESQAELIFDLLDALRIEKCSLIGHSMGGAIAIIMALQRPERLRQLIAIEPNLRAGDAQLSRKIVEYADEADFWEIVGMLHDLYFELYPEQHCDKVQEIMREKGLDERIIHAVASHGYSICVDIRPEHHMEKVLFASDELTGLIGAAALMRPSKSVQDMELSSLKKKFKDKKFAAGCDRGIIENGAQMLGWELDTLLDKTLAAMRACEEKANDEKYYEK